MWRYPVSAPTTDRTRTAAAATIPAQRTRRGRAGWASEPAVLPAPRRSSQPNRRATTTGAQKAGTPKVSGTQKAYARREERLRRLAGGPQARGAAAGRAQFVLLVMGLLGVGLVATLWLSTAAAADSYRLQDARAAARASCSR